jgi:tRNA (guanine37-N1)-methyltransferase
MIERAAMRFDIITIFPGFFAGFFEHGIVRRAQTEGLLSIGVHDLRNFTHDRHRTVDDRPFGGGEGMVLKPEPLARALASIGIAPNSERNERTSFPILGPEMEAMGSAPKQPPILPLRDTSIDPDPYNSICTPPGTLPYTQGQDDKAGKERGSARTRVILTSAQGRPFDQSVARELARVDRVVLICGRYEGVDERINALYCDCELSIGDYVLSGGELAAAVVLDATMRLLPGVLGNEASGEFESFGATDASITTGLEGVPRSQHGAGGLLDYPHYTRPAEFAGLRAPGVLLNGDHRQIRRWRREQQLRKTLANRPDLLEQADLSEEDRRILEAIRKNSGQ